ncbi:hypothetical protein PoMZ_02564 [Pyricularia oryzae]|uniref:Uncharacterized protein n=1 Tax=Pyricularia oryzae TaxID=318829 RepID=A0A4P7N8M8_PYROR|nr:hypothetical protein PoMZ_02564 [Pyricularia oryzae]
MAINGCELLKGPRVGFHRISHTSYLIHLISSANAKFNLPHGIKHPQNRISAPPGTITKYSLRITSVTPSAIFLRNYAISCWPNISSDPRPAIAFRIVPASGTNIQYMDPALAVSKNI